MLRRSLLLVPCLSAWTAAHAQRAFTPGQTWSLKAAQPISAKVVIGRVEASDVGTVVHVSIIDVPIPAGLPNPGGTTTIWHMPFDQAAFAASVDRLLGTNAASSADFEGGYRQWEAAKGGVFTIGVQQALEVVFGAMKQTPPSPR
jgi:hypothetical protein